MTAPRSSRPGRRAILWTGLAWALCWTAPVQADMLRPAAVPWSPLPALGQAAGQPGQAGKPVLLAQAGGRGRGKGKAGGEKLNAEAAPPEVFPPPSDKERATEPEQPTESEKAEAEARAAAAKAAAAQPTCQTDSQCPARNVCLDGECQPVRKPVSALFYYHRAGPRGYRIIAPFYFSVWNPTRWTQIVAPLYGYRRNNEQGSRDLFIVPFLYQYHREPGETSHRVWPIFFYSNFGDKGAAAGLLPLFYGHRRGPQTVAVMPPLLSFYHHNREKDLTQGLILGVAYARKERDARTVVIPPLLTLTHQRKDGGTGLVLGAGWFHRDKDRLYAGIFPLGWYFGDKTGHTTVVLPLFIEGRDSSRGLHHVTLLPLFHHRSEADGKRRLLVTPLGGLYRDTERGISVGALLTPPLIHREEPNYRVTVLPPWAVFWKNKQTGKSAGYVGPVFWSRDDTGSTAGLLPIYFRFHEARGDATTHVLAPIAALHTGPRMNLGFVGPFYGWRGKGADQGGGGGIFPLLMFGTGPRAHALVVPPLFAYTRDRDAGRSHLSIGPFFYRSRSKGPEAGYDTGLLPLLFVGRRGDVSYQALLPLFYHRREPYAERTVLGLGYLFRDFARRPGDPDAGTRAGLFPLLWLKRTPQSSYAVLAPIFWYARQGQRSVGVIGPVFWQRDEKAKSTAAGLFPLVYAQRSPAQSLFLSPLVVYHRSEAAQRRIVAVGPFVHVEQGRGAERSVTDALLPLAFFHRGPNRSAQVIFPLYIQARDEDTTVRTAALLYWGVRSKTASAHVLAPIFAHARTAWSTTTVVGPGFYHRRHDGSVATAGLLPLFFYRRDANSTLITTPLGFAFRDRKDEVTKTAFLFFYGVFRKDRSDYGLFPLFFGARRGTATAQVGPLFYHSADPAQDRALTVLGPLYFGHRGPATFGGLLPLIFGRNDGQGGYKATVVPLFHINHTAGKSPSTSFYTLLFGFKRQVDGYRAYLGPIYLRRDGEMNTEALFPIFYHGWNKPLDTSTTVLVPLFLRRRSPESTLTVVTPLLWHYATLTKRTTFVFPVALDIHNLYQSRLTAVGPLVPLFIRKRDYAENTTSWIFPPLLTYVKRHADGHHDFAVFPLLWNFGDRHHRTTVVFPLFYDIKRPSYRAGVGIPFYLYYKDDNSRILLIPPLLTYDRKYADGRRNTVVLPFYYYTKEQNYERHVFAPVGAYWKDARTRHVLVLNSYTAWGVGPRRGAWEFHFWPLFSFGRPRPRDLEWNILGGFMGYERLGVNRTFKLLWGIQIPMEPVGARTAWYGATLRMSSAREW